MTDFSTNTIHANEAINKLKGFGSKIAESGFGKHIAEDFGHIKKAAAQARDVFETSDSEFMKKGAAKIDEQLAAEHGMGAVKAEEMSSLKAERLAALETEKGGRSFEKIGSTLLEDIGRGSKAAGGTKLGAYMIGGAMLADMLNPFN